MQETRTAISYDTHMRQKQKKKMTRPYLLYFKIELNNSQENNAK